MGETRSLEGAKHMNIGEVAEFTTLPAKTIRYYEEIGLLIPHRRPNGYRDYSQTDAHKLAFLGRARALGFSIEECRALLALYEDEARASADVKRIATDHLKRIEAKIADRRHMIEHNAIAPLGHDRQLRAGFVRPHAQAKKADAKPLANCFDLF